MTQNETTLIEQKDLRDQCITKVEVLDKVKELFLLPGMEMMSTKMVADYYEVDQEVIYKCYNRNKKEIDPDGVCVKKQREFLTGQDVQTEKLPYKVVLHLNDGTTFDVPNSGLRMFSRRAVLRIGMLLRDSRVAQEVRTQLLNTFKVATVEQKTAAITTEEALIMNFAKALASGDAHEMFTAYSELMEFKNRYITEIENRNAALSETNRALAAQELTWEDRAIFNKMVRIMAHEAKTYPGKIFNEIYNDLHYKHHIALKARKKEYGESGGLIDYVREKEWSIVWQVVAALAEQYNLDYSDIKRRARLEG